MRNLKSYFSMDHRPKHQQQPLRLQQPKKLLHQQRKHLLCQRRQWNSHRKDMQIRKIFFFFRNDVFYAYLSRILLKTTNPRIINTKFTKKFIMDRTEKLFFKVAQACSDHRWLAMEISGAHSNFQVFLILLTEWVTLKERYTYYISMAHIFHL